MSDQQSDQPPPDEPQGQRRVTARTFERVVDQQIRQAEEAGLFRDLPGAGRPLNLDDDRGVPEEERLGFRMLKGAGYAPPWVELRRTIVEEQAELAHWLARANGRWPAMGPTDRAQARAAYAERLRDLNKQITTYNLIAPPAAGQLPLLLPAEELRKLGG